MSEATQGRPAAGWYADPSQPGSQRYWDGAQWTPYQAAAVPNARPYGGGAYGSSPQAETSTQAILALILAFVFFPLGIVFGILGRREVDRSGGLKTGRGLATAGLWIGIVQAVLTVIYIVFFIGFIATTATYN